MPLTSVDDELALCVVRPELVTQFVQFKLRQRIAERKEKEKEEVESKPGDVKEESKADKNGKDTANVTENDKTVTASTEGKKTEGADGAKDADVKEEEEPASIGLSDEDSAYLESLKFNLNALLPYTRKLEGVDDAIIKQVEQDEELIRELACFLWDRITPGVHRAVKEGQIPHLPVDGASLTEFLHRHGINCCYLGRLGSWPANKRITTKGLSTGESIIVERKMMPKCWKW